MKASKTSHSISKLANEAVRHESLEDNQEDLQAFADRSKESTISYQQLLKELKQDRRELIPA